MTEYDKTNSFVTMRGLLILSVISFLKWIFVVYLTYTTDIFSYLDVTFPRWSNAPSMINMGLIWILWLKNKGRLPSFHSKRQETMLIIEVIGFVLIFYSFIYFVVLGQ